MKPHITFPKIRLRVRPYLALFILLPVIFIVALRFFPEPAKNLTVFDNNQQLYLQRCPNLSPVTYLAKEKTTGLPSPFTLLNWNIYKQRKPQWQEKLQEWAKDADLLTLQEVKYSPELTYFSETNNFYYLQNYAFKYRDYIYGVNTLSKQPALAVCGTRDSEPWIRVPKTALASSYALANSTDLLLLINLHGINFTFTAEPLSKQLQPYLELIKTHSGPIIFSGDFNSWSGQRLAAIEAPLLKSGFNEVLFAKDQRMTIFNRPLDHIYFRGLKVIKAESIATTASDHTPQRVTFALNKVTKKENN
ncbi:MAG: endonuclease/exonuclease/phosphatase (EEP) superfamily protein YafD [Psychromonas sp.]|jgi:endonuclease/exonuclease/phosphatase (EEP) superfamily protein YafD|uniref:endonuclease/exonuclease/phosphatase family protein n=1 Tax=Psychromonas sp. TaxID=1884585 RepID=UPI0039E3357A